MSSKKQDHFTSDQKAKPTVGGQKAQAAISTEELLRLWGKPTTVSEGVHGVVEEILRDKK